MFTCYTPTGGNSTSQTPWLSNINADTYSLSNVTSINLGRDGNSEDESTGQLDFTGKNDNGSSITYSAIRTSVTDSTTGSENGALRFKGMVDGTLSDFFVFQWSLT